MASTSQIQSDAHAGPQSPQLQQAPTQATDAVVPDAHTGRGHTVPEPLNLPDICKPEWQRDGMPDTEFNRKYPPDPWGEEVSPNARIWKIYHDQQTDSDKGLLDGWNKSLDVLLIFAGLFSAVLTAFLIESYKALQPDYTQYVAAFLYAAAVSHNSTGNIFPELHTIVAPDRFVQTSDAQRWINGLWFTSLVISLAVALLCILIKQWLDEYDSHISSRTASEKYWAERHCMYHRGLKMWGVHGLISFLPLLLHLSLFLFFVGLILFLHPLDSAIAYSLLGMVSCMAAFYVLSLAIPAWRVECPSYTPLLAQALLVVSRAISPLPYTVRPLSWLADHSTGRLHSALSAVRTYVSKWFGSIQLHTGEQHERETHTITKYTSELDGYVLSTLIQLPTDSNRDIINAACTALPAVRSSRRTIDVISSQVSRPDLRAKLDECYRNTPWTVTGFAITSHEQLWRAYEALLLANQSYWYLARNDLFGSQFGFHSFLLRALSVQDADENDCNIDPLIRQLRGLHSQGVGSQVFPRRSECLVFLEFYSLHAGQHLFNLTYFLLFFCAGRFASADTLEPVRALRSVELVLEAACSINTPAHDGGDGDYILAAANGLWHMLADFQAYNIDILTAKIAASQTSACFNRSFDSPIVWAQISGLSAFIRSPAFIDCLPTEGSPDIGQTVGNDGRLVTALSLAKYSRPFRYFGILDRAKVRLEEYWVCIATLMKLSWDIAWQSEDVAPLFSAHTLFPVESSHWNCTDRLSEGGPYATQDDWYEPALAAFLDSPNAIATWTYALPSSTNGKRIHVLGDLAHRISIVLCRRQRLGRANDAFVSAFFSGPFLLARFQDRVSRPRPVSRPPDLAMDHRFSYEDAVDDLAKHCLKLSPESFMAICGQLEETGDEESELRARAVAFGQRIRALSTECNADCPCMLPAARAPTSTPAPTRWDALAARFRREHAEPATASNV